MAGTGLRVGPALAALLALVLTGCVRLPEPPAAVLRSTAPPWDAPRDAVSYIEAAGLASHPLSVARRGRSTRLAVRVEGDQVVVPAHIGIDRVRAVQASAHTHDDTGAVALEGRDANDATLGQFFTLWGVRFGDDCLGATCGQVLVLADGRPVLGDPANLRLGSASTIEVSARS